MPLSDRTAELLLGALGDREARDELVAAADNDELVANALQAQLDAEQVRLDQAVAIHSMLKTLESTEDIKNSLSLLTSKLEVSDIQLVYNKLDDVHEQINTLLSSVATLAAKCDKLTLATTHMAAHIDHTATPGTPQTTEFLTDLE